MDWLLWGWTSNCSFVDLNISALTFTTLKDSFFCTKTRLVRGGRCWNHWRRHCSNKYRQDLHEHLKTVNVKTDEESGLIFWTEQQLIDRNKVGTPTAAKPQMGSQAGRRNHKECIIRPEASNQQLTSNYPKLPILITETLEHSVMRRFLSEPGSEVHWDKEDSLSLPQTKIDKQIWKVRNQVWW